MSVVGASYRTGLAERWSTACAEVDGCMFPCRFAIVPHEIHIKSQKNA